MQVFDLSVPQAEYILELRLRRLTKFSQLDLEKENEQLAAEIAELEDILANEVKLKSLVGAEMADVAKTYGTPRRTVLLDSAGGEGNAEEGAPLSNRRKNAGAPLEIEDTPCWVMLSATGLIARTSDDTKPVRDDTRNSNDVLTSVIPASGRAEIGVVTNLGRLVKVSVLELPTLPPTQGSPSLSGGIAISHLVELEKKERVVGIASLSDDSPTLALGTKLGTVKRVTQGDFAKSAEWEVINLKQGDEVVSCVSVSDESELVFISTDASLLRYPASAVRPQGRAAGGMAGIKLGAEQEVLFFGALNPDEECVVVTIAGDSSALPGTSNGSAKMTPFDAFPAKGRATGGVRAHRFLKGEDTLLLGWAGGAPARACSAKGAPAKLPDLDPRRDGSGTALDHAIFAVG